MRPSPRVMKIPAASWSEGPNSGGGSRAEIAQLDMQSARTAERLKEVMDLSGAGRGV
jgi:hypothetical protein